ncbi:hypothetical protein Tco_0122879 [Tanacetum coccineum]
MLPFKLRGSIRRLGYRPNPVMGLGPFRTAGQRVLVGLDLVLEQVRDMESYTNEKKPLVLPWGRTLRLDSGVRVVILTTVKVGERGFSVTLDEDTYLTFLHEDGTEMDLFAFIQVADPTKVKVGERECAEGGARLFETTVGRVVPLLPVAPARTESELDASVDKLFDESGGADQGDSATGGGQEIEADIVTGVRFIDAENVVVEKPKRPRKKRQAAADASGPSHPSKKLRSDHGTLGGAASAGKSPTVLKQLLASSILNVEFGVEAVATLPFCTSSVLLLLSMGVLFLPILSLV